MPLPSSAVAEAATSKNTTDPATQLPARQARCLRRLRACADRAAMALIRAQDIASRCQCFRLVAFHLRRETALLAQQEAQP